MNWRDATDQTLIEGGWVKLPDGSWVKGENRIRPQGPFPEYAPATPKPPKRLRQSSKPLMNKLEQEWYNICVGAYPEGTKFVPQGIRFKLGNGIWYKPDLLVFGDKIYAYECKGPFAHRGGFENLKVAAHQYPWIRWSLVWKENKAWQEQEILP